MDQDTFHCTLCCSKFNQRKKLLRHMRTIHGDESHKCEFCNATFNQISNLRRHMNVHKKRSTEEDVALPHKYMKTLENNSCASPQPSECNWCGQRKKLMSHKPYCVDCSKKGRECKQCHRPMPEKYYSRDVSVCDACCTKREKRLHRGGAQTSLCGAVEIQKILPSEHNKHDPLLFFLEKEKMIRDHLEGKIEEKGSIKWYLTLQVNYYKITILQEITTNPYFKSDVFIATTQNVEEELSISFQQLLNRVENFEREGSAWQISQIIKLDINIAQYSPISGSSYVKLPAILQAKKAILNIQNNDEYCFKWSVLPHLYLFK